MAELNYRSAKPEVRADTARTLQYDVRAEVTIADVGSGKPVRAGRDAGNHVFAAGIGGIPELRTLNIHGGTYERLAVADIVDMS